ncbi:MAG: glycosyltransferase [Candidatus Paceibacterota bacterium]
MKIAIFSDTFPPQTNGVAKVAYQSAKMLADLGHKVMVFTVAKNFGDDPRFTQSDNFKIVRLPSLPALVYPGERFTIPLGISLPYLRKFKPDVIHVHTPLLVGTEGLFTAKILKVPFIGTHHTFYDHYLKHVKLDYDWMKKLSWKLTAGFYNRCDFVITPSDEMLKDLKKSGLKSEVVLLRNSIDIESFNPVSSKKEKEKIKKSLGIKGKSICYIGRVSYEKSIDQIIRAFVIMLKKMPDLTLVIAGGGPEEEKLKKLAKELGVKEKVIFTGPYNYTFKGDIVKIIQANDLYMTACKNEVMPLAILEAMATGLPLVVVKEKGLSEPSLMVDGKNGFFAKTDDPKDMAEKALKILSNSRLAAKFGKESRAKAEEYSNEKITNKLIDFYEKIAKNKK